jgi:branched-chain amino acid aminotransferase
MNFETCLLTHFIRDNNVLSCCDFIPEQLNKGVLIYEVVRVIGGVPLFFIEHVERFNNSAKNSGFKSIVSKKSLTLRIKALIEINKLIDGNIRFQLSLKDDNSEIFSAWICPYFYPSTELYHKGISVLTTSAQRNNPNVKLYNNILSKEVNSLIQNNDIYEVLLVNKDGCITEGSRSNVFFVIDDTIITPPVSAVLPGVTRLKVIEASQNVDLICKEIKIEFSSISQFHGAFITGTSPKVLPIFKINNVHFDSNHKTIKKIINEYDRIVENDIQFFKWQ